MSVTAVQRVIKTAKGEVGTHEGRSHGRWDNDQKYSDEVPGLEWSDFQPWCAVFVSWVAMRAGCADLYPRTASCDTAGAWYKKLGRWSEYPAMGAQIFYGSPRDLSHTGLVIGYDAQTVTTVEGNTNASGSREGDGVYVKKHQRGSTNLVGYGYPRFPEGMTSADPRYNGQGATTTHSRDDGSGQPARRDAVDLSHHNVGVTLSTLRQAKQGGVRFVLHKATEGFGFVDSQYQARRRLSDLLELPFGGYHFAKPRVSGGRQQARHYLSVAQPRPGDVGPALDLEDPNNIAGLSRAQVTDWVHDFIDECQRELGTSTGLLYTQFDLEDDFGWHLWAARYNDAMRPPRVPTPWSAWTIWQFTNGQAGIPRDTPGLGTIDASTLAGDPTTVLPSLTIPEDDMTPDQLFEALESDRGQAAIRKAVACTPITVPPNVTGWTKPQVSLVAAIQRMLGATVGEGADEGKAQEG